MTVEAQTRPDSTRSGSTRSGSTDRIIRRFAGLALAVTVAAFLGLGTMAAGWTDSWSQDLAMLAVIVVIGLALLSILLNLGLLVASLIRGLRHGVGPMKPVYVYLVLAALGYAAITARVLFSE